LQTIKSPCIRNCCLDKYDVCIGCGRTFEEIISWGDALDAEKIIILKAAKKRTVESKENF